MTEPHNHQDIEIENNEFKRPSWDEYFLKIAMLVSERSTCRRRAAGAVLVRDKKIISTGYNGAPAGMKDSLELGCKRTELGIKSGEQKQICRAIHAEANAIIQAALHGVTTKNATLYSTTDPCITCAKMLINAGITKVVSFQDRSDKEDDFKLVFNEDGVEFIRLPQPETTINYREYKRV